MEAIQLLFEVCISKQKKQEFNRIFYIKLGSKTDTSLRCPLRQTLPIFKQPVTHYPIERDEVKAQILNTGKPSEKTKPRQLFWEKRFQNIRPIDIDEKPFEHIKLPEPIKSKKNSMIS
jgi:hypothetical protein